MLNTHMLLRWGAFLAVVLAQVPLSAQDQAVRSDWIRIGVVGKPFPLKWIFDESGEIVEIIMAVNIKFQSSKFPGKTRIITAYVGVADNPFLAREDAQASSDILAGDVQSFIQECEPNAICTDIVPWDGVWTAALVQRGANSETAAALELEYRRIHAVLLLNPRLSTATAETLRSATLRFRRSLAQLLQQITTNSPVLHADWQQTLTLLTRWTDEAEALTDLIDVLQHQ